MRKSIEQIKIFKTLLIRKSFDQNPNKIIHPIKAIIEIQKQKSKQLEFLLHAK